MELTAPVVICGYGSVAARVAECLVADCVPLVIVNQNRPEELPAGARVVVGDCRKAEVLAEAGVATARAVIICTSEELVNVAALLAVRSIAADVRIVVRSFNPKFVARLGSTLRNVVALSVSGLAAPVMALLARTGSALGTVNTPEGTLPVVEYVIDAESPYLGKAIDELPVRPLALIDGKPRFLRSVPRQHKLAAGERLFAVGPAGALAESIDVRWASWLRRYWRIVARTWAEADRAVRLCSVVFLTVLVASVVVLVINGFGIADGFYEAVSVMATGADLKAEKHSPFVKSYVGALRIVGAVLFACFTAILTNYLVRSRLGGVLELSRIPDGGHVIVCGLGNVGFRIVEELHQVHQPVAVVDTVREGRFVATARQLGAAIVHGDATVAEVLRQAKVESARAVIAVTSNDLLNVEIALLVRELSPTTRVVVRLHDGEFAKMLRDAANVQLAIAVPDLAAPAFVAALYGDRVQSVFFVAGKLMAAIELTIEMDQASLIGKTVRKVTGDAGLVPIGVRTAGGTPVTSLDDHKLAHGDCLIAVAAMSGLDGIYRRFTAAVAEH